MRQLKLIIFEGMDGSGKSTQIDLAYDELIAKGYKVIKLREPGSTTVGEKIREILKSNIEMDNTTIAYLFASARNEINIKINKLLKEGYIVLCDRHFISSYAYQGIDIASKINEYAMNHLDKKFEILYFDINYETYIKRKIERNEASDRFEDKLLNREYFNDVRNIYLNVSNTYKANIIDSNNKSIEDIQKETFDKILKLIEEE